MSALRLLALLLVAVSAGPAVDLILQNQRLYDRAIRCFLGQQTCTPQFLQVRDQVLQVIKDGCKGCGPEVKSMATEVLHFLKEKKPGDFKRLVQKYDPDGTLRKNFAEEYGLNVDNL